MEINIGKKINLKRKEKGMTQEDLANYMGVSKAAISKWESGQSYPDITLLPILATFFNVSIDELIGYEPQMTEEDIRELYQNISKKFATKSFSEVYEECKEYAKKYYSCWKLQFYIGLLLINNAEISSNPIEIVMEAKEIFNRVAKESNDVKLEKKAIELEAFCNICLNEPVEAIELLEQIIDVDSATEVLLSRAYSLKGDYNKAKSVLQGYMYQNIIGTINACSDFIMLYKDDLDKAEDCYDKAMKMSEIFGFDKNNPSYITILLSKLQVEAINKDKEKVYKTLEQCIGYYRDYDNLDLSLFPNEFFDLLDDLINSTDLRGGLPRDKSIIKSSIRNCIVNNPDLEFIKEEEKYKNLIKIMG